MDILDDEPITDEELERFALAADPDMILPTDAVPLFDFFGGNSMLPAWYMPVSSGNASGHRGWKRSVAIVIIVAFIAINLAGLCSTYGIISIA